MGEDSHSWVERDRRRVWHGFTQMAAYADLRPVMVERAEGRELIDVDGRRYLDAISSLWVTTLGHRVAQLDEALAAQAERVAHSTLLGNGNTVVVELAEELADRVPIDDPRFLFASDGASAVEQALKIAFQYWHNLGEPGRTRYLVLGDAYHGDTVGSLSLGAGGFGTDLFDPLRFPGVMRRPGYRDRDWLDQSLSALAAHGSSLAAAVIEPLVQGAAGMYMTDPGQVRAFAAACREAGVLLVCDEVATGFGRTGALFASELCGVRPDLMSIGKGIAGGYLPMSATVVSGPVAEAFEGEDLGPRTFYHGHSFGGNAVGAAVALRHLQLFAEWAVLDNVEARAEQLRKRLAPLAAAVARRHLALFEEWAVLDHVRERGEQLAVALSELAADEPAVREVRSRGLMAGVELDPPADGLRWGRKVCAAAVDRGVLLRPLGDVVVLMPILTSTAEEIDRIVGVLAEAIECSCRK